MIGVILVGIIRFIFHFINIFLGAIDTFIVNNFPVISDGLNAINDLFSYVLSFIGFCLDATGLTSVAITLIVGYLGFSFISTFVSRLVKVALKWWDKLV